MKKGLLRRALLFMGVATFLIVESGCKGRTIENVEPTGDTVEVVIVEEVDSI